MFPFDDVIVTRNARCYLIYSTELWIKHQIYQNCPDSRTKSTNTDDTGPILLFQHKVVFIEEIWHMRILSDLATYIKRQESKIRHCTNYARYSSKETVSLIDFSVIWWVRQLHTELADSPFSQPIWRPTCRWELEEQFTEWHDDIMTLKRFPQYWPLWGNSSVTGGFPTQRANNAISLWFLCFDPKQTA